MVVAIRLLRRFPCSRATNWLSRRKARQAKSIQAGPKLLSRKGGCGCDEWPARLQPSEPPQSGRLPLTRLRFTLVSSRESILTCSSKHDCLLMDQPPYLAIPDTSDSRYWALKVVPDALRSTTFVPRDKVLHQKLKVAAWAIIQASLPRNRRKGHY